MKPITLLTVLCSLTSIPSSAEGEPIKIENGSFDSGAATSPAGWRSNLG